MLAMRPLLIFANDRKVFGHPCKMLRVFIVANIVSGGAGGCLARRYDAWGTFCDVSDRKVFWVTAGSEFPPRNVWFHFVTFLHISFGKICRLITKNQRNRNEYFDERAESEFPPRNVWLSIWLLFLPTAVTVSTDGGDCFYRRRLLGGGYRDFAFKCSPTFLCTGYQLSRIHAEKEA